MSRCIKSYTDVVMMEQPTLLDILEGWLKKVTQIFGSIK